MKKPRTVNGLALCKVAVVLASEKSVSISPNYSFDIPVIVSTTFHERSAIDKLVPAIHVEKETFHSSGYIRKEAWRGEALKTQSSSVQHAKAR